jgi:hypothetical protein
MSNTTSVIKVTATDLDLRCVLFELGALNTLQKLARGQ